MKWEPGTTVKRTDARASTRQVTYLRELESRLGWQIAWPIYLAEMGERIDNRLPAHRYKNLTREQASTLIEAYKAA